MNASAEPLQVLVIEDTPDHAEILGHYFDSIKIPIRMLMFSSGEEAIEYLDGRTAVEGAGRHSLPDLIFLDLRLAGENGIDTLKKIKANRILKPIPVIIQTASREHKDLIEAYRYGGTFFMKKPYDEKILKDLISQLRISSLLKK